MSCYCNCNGTKPTMQLSTFPDDQYETYAAEPLQVSHFSTDKTPHGFYSTRSNQAKSQAPTKQSPITNETEPVSHQPASLTDRDFISRQRHLPDRDFHIASASRPSQTRLLPPHPSLLRRMASGTYLPMSTHVKLNGHDATDLPRIQPTMARAAT